MLRLRGGGKKRKKKVYTTPKKIKHKRKKTKLAVLKYYKVDADGKIERLRRECPNPDVCLFPFSFFPFLFSFFSLSTIGLAGSNVLCFLSVVLASSWLLCQTVNTVAVAI